MNEELCRLLAKAVAVNHLIRSRREEHKAKVKELDAKRHAIYLRASEFDESSSEMDEFNRQLDSIDKKEFELHDNLRKFLKQADGEITKTVNAITEYRFGPNSHWDLFV